ncbi:MAG: branched-chain amino acid ABC transporter permease [Pseudomonadota bacterium]
MDNLVIVLFQIFFAMALFTLISLGLAIIFGMMRVMNLAQGEFIMLGAYICTLAWKAGLTVWGGFLLAMVGVGLFGILVERLVIRFLYGRIIDTLLATWGLSLFLVGAVTLIFGPQSESAPTPLGNFHIGNFSIAHYSLVLIGLAITLVTLTYTLWRFTRFGLMARATMQNSNMAEALGVRTNRIYMLTFGLGSALTGLAGAILVPFAGASPPMGIFFVAKAFITVITGGQMALLGTLSASSLFGSIDGVVSYFASSVAGEISVLMVAIVLLRLLPKGITGRFQRGL